MPSISEISDWLSEYLELAKFPLDNSVNGLQVEAGEEVNKVAFAVDAGLEVFRKAKSAGAQMLVVHHGLYWKGSEMMLTGINAHRIGFLMNNRLSLYAAHLPLDAHGEIGNNVSIIRALGLKPKLVFENIAYTAVSQFTLGELVERVEKKVGKVRQKLEFGPKTAENIVVCSGAGGYFAHTVPDNSTLIIGEMHNSVFHPALEKKLNVIACGHYDTEVFGVRKLAEKVGKKFGVETVFVDFPTGI
jgi:dinuclear metal center YbgI/SA1388 family protein